MDYQLRDYQQNGSDRMLQRYRQYLVFEPGLGKSITTLDAIRRADTDINVVIGTKNSLYVWKDETHTHLNADSVIYTGPPHKRRKAWESYLKGDQLFLITNYAMAPELLELMHQTKMYPQTITCDEIHRAQAGLLNHKTQTFKKLQPYLKAADYFFPLTGTPIRKNLADLYAPLNLIDQKRFKGYWPFVNTYCTVFDNGYGKEIMKRPRDPQAMIDLNKQYLIYCSKKEALPELPPKTRQPIPIEMSSSQQRMYNQMEKEMILELENGDILAAPNRATAIVRLRQLLVSPQILGGTELGPAIETLIDLVDEQFAVGRPVVIFTPFRPGVDLISNALRRHLQVTELYNIVGGMDDEEIGHAWKSFQQSLNPRRAIVATIGSSASWNAHSASTAFFVGCEWSAIDNTQAEDRVHRFGSINPVHIYYLLFKDTVDDLVMDKLNDKAQAENWVLRTKEVLERSRRKIA